MKIEITNEGDCNGYHIYESGTNRPMRNFRRNFIRLYDFDDDDIENLLGCKAYKTFVNGKFTFNVTKSHLQLITGERLASTRQELSIYND